MRSNNVERTLMCDIFSPSIFFLQQGLEGRAITRGLGVWAFCFKGLKLR